MVELSKSDIVDVKASVVGTEVTRVDTPDMALDAEALIDMASTVVDCEK